MLDVSMKGTEGIHFWGRDSALEEGGGRKAERGGKGGRFLLLHTISNSVYKNGFPYFHLS